MLKLRHIFALGIGLVLLSSCSSTKNTAGTRWYHSFNARYNIYFNGETAYQDALKNQQESYQENYSSTILMFPVSALPKDKANSGGPFDKPIEKGVKAIKVHSIQTKPEKQSGKRNDPKYQEWMNRKEYNPFLHNAWMLMAKSQFHNGDFLQAASSFSYISRLYTTQPEIAMDAKIWQARCYSEIAWYYEADDILSKIKKADLPKRLQDWYDTVYADYLVKQKLYKDAVPYLQTAIHAEKNKLQKNREKYLLGQIYSQLGQKDLAYKTYSEVAGASVPFPLQFSAKIRQSEVYAGGDTTQITKELRKMAKSSKSKDYLDQVYYALGNVYMAVPDTAKAIAAYEMGVEKSVQQGLDKALNQIRLGDIYFDRQEFIKAQPNYAEALPQLKKEDEAYPRVSLRSAVLDNLVVYVEAVELQDSLQRLARMPEEERLQVIDKIIADLKKKEAEEKKKQERDEFLAQREDTRSTLNANRPGMNRPNTVTAPGEEGTFYFYNPQMVAIGKNSFQQQWGRRKLEDDWRRRNKTNSMGDLFAEDNPLSDNKEIGDVAENKVATDSVDTKAGAAGLSSDPHEPPFYLQQLPVTEEDFAASNLIIEDGLYNMAVIYKDELQDYRLAVKTFDELNTRFPGNENQLQTYYHIYLIYLKEENTAMVDLYKQKIRAEFPESEYAIAMADPDYEYHLRTMDAVQESWYEASYQAYLDGNVALVRQNYQWMESRYSQSKLMPKFMFLNALSYVQTRDADGFKKQLRELISKYPDADVSALATEMMKGFQRGLILSASGDNMLARGSLFNMHFGGEDDTVADSTLVFSKTIETPHQLLIIYPQGSIDDNLLLYTVASFNFGNFILTDFDLEKTITGNIGMLHVKGFNNFAEIMQYVKMIYGAEGYAAGLEKSAVAVPISLENYAILMKGKTLEDYMKFFEENFGKDYQNLIRHWKASQAKELETIEEKPMEQLVPEIETQSPLEVSVEDTDNMNIPETLPTDSVPSVYDLEKQRIDQKTDEMVDQAQDIFNQGTKIVDNVNASLNEIAGDPVRGIQKLFTNLFQKKSSNAIDEYAKEQEKAEKEHQKQLKQEQAAAEKALREEALQKEKEQKEALKKQAEEEKALLKAKKQQEEELAKLKKQEEKAKVEKKRLQKEKADLQKQKEQERKEAQKLKEQQRKEKEKAREEARKQKEKERKEALKLKEQERKAKAKKN